MEKNTKITLRRALKFVGIVVSTELAGVIGSIFTMPAINSWYASLQKPSFNPPNWLFAPVWTALFLMMGIAVFLVSESKAGKPEDRKKAIILFYVQLGFNVLWNVIFFGLNNLFLAFIEIILLLGLIILVTIRFFKINQIAGGLMISYILWVTFASILTYSIMVLNI